MNYNSVMQLSPGATIIHPWVQSVSAAGDTSVVTLHCRVLSYTVGPSRLARALQSESP